MPLEWHGKEIAARALAAQLAAVSETTREAADDAAHDHWWQSRTGQLQSEVISEPAHPVPGGVAGKFGTTRRRGFYGLFEELKRPFLRPAADRVFPTLQEKLHKRYNP